MHPNLLQEALLAFGREPTCDSVALPIRWHYALPAVLGLYDIESFRNCNGNIGKFM